MPCQTVPSIECLNHDASSYLLISTSQNMSHHKISASLKLLQRLRLLSYTLKPRYSLQGCPLPVAVMQIGCPSHDTLSYLLISTSRKMSHAMQANASISTKRIGHLILYNDCKDSNYSNMDSNLDIRSP